MRLVIARVEVAASAAALLDRCEALTGTLRQFKSNLRFSSLIRCSTVKSTKRSTASYPLKTQNPPVHCTTDERNQAWPFLLGGEAGGSYRHCLVRFVAHSLLFGKTVLWSAYKATALPNSPQRNRVPHEHGFSRPRTMRSSYLRSKWREEGIISVAKGEVGGNVGVGPSDSLRASVMAWKRRWREALGESCLFIFARKCS